MRTRDPEAKRRLLLDGALAEFAEFGLAGARVDRIARRAGISPGLVYSFHGGKAELFDAVFDAVVEAVMTAAPFDPDDLPAYAGALYDSGVAHPEVTRFLRWYELERGDTATRTSAGTSMASKVAALADAQSRGVVSSAMPAPHLLALVLTIANMWAQNGEDVRTLAPPEDRRQIVTDAVRQLVARPPV
ncbi:TetR family transcriptional regulator [Propionicicella superfundia]|uniref:TetR family transcriptional regulator n=1 Tax=Propionicicella superfundia TaxID=348582 RepID=UPI0004118B2D|nr:TetR family transcriptional regulator [Propionicicella superfundia]